MKNPSPGSCLGGCGRPGEGTVEIGAALTTTMRRTPVASHRPDDRPRPLLRHAGLGHRPRPHARTAPRPRRPRPTRDVLAPESTRSAVTTRTPFRLGRELARVPDDRRHLVTRGDGLLEELCRRCLRSRRRS